MKSHKNNPEEGHYIFLWIPVLVIELTDGNTSVQFKAADLSILFENKTFGMVEYLL